ncbi:MAG TPA: ABC transporter permease [Acetobacteraceae bacterium]|jgi:branched-chain amino acid transport system substrate-binding protein|nr:ABC transporter permease [Acetobacteraceae bacterium]
MKPWLAVITACFALFCASLADAQPLRIGVMTDINGMISDISGAGSVVAARLAVEDFGPTVLNRPIEVVVGDHQNKPDIGASIARQWFDRDGVQMVIDLPNSSVALAVERVADDHKKIFIASTGLAADITGKACIPTGFQWATDTYALAHGIANAVVKAGGKTWFLLTADYAFGKNLAADGADAVKKAGGTLIGQVLHPFDASEFSTYLIAAKASGAQVIGLANGAGDTINSIKQAHEFGIDAGGQQIAAFLLYITDVNSIGLEVAKGTYLVNSFYWDMDDKTRAFSKRFAALHRGRKPTFAQAAVYSGVFHYLRAVKAAGTDDGPTVAAKMKELPVDDFYTHGAKVRADGRIMRDHYLFQVKAPAESKEPWDYYKLIATIPGAEAVRPVAENPCPLLH